MGLFDKLKCFVNSGELDKLTESAEKTVNTFINEQTAAAQNHSAPSANQNGNTASDSLLSTANIPPKPDFTVNDDYGDKKYSFELSGDYFEFKVTANLCPPISKNP